MPLLRRQQFVKISLPEDLDPEEELFYCKLTNEVFRDYEAFFERIILCNSLAWTCEMTGKPDLTYAEALDSEKMARDNLKAMPVYIKKIILYLASLSKRLRLGELCHDVFTFMKGRLFVGEYVDVVINGNKKACVVVKVIAPRTNKKKSVSEAATENDGEEMANGGDDIATDTNVSKYKYKVRQLDDPGGDLPLVSTPNITRKKGVYSREKNKLLLKNACEVVNEIWVVKAKLMEKYKIFEMRFKDIFNGSKPNFESHNLRKLPPHSGAVASTVNSKVKSKNIEKKGKKSGESSGKKRKASVAQERDNSKAARDAERIRMNKEAAMALKKAKRAMEERRKAKEDIKKKLIEARIKMKEEKEKEKEKQREEKRILAECLREWQKPRDDLECDDLTELPGFVPVDCGVPNDLFGDAVMVLEFINNFADQLLIKDIFPQGLNFETLATCVVESDIQGSLNDLLQLLLRVMFKFQEEEDLDQANLDHLDKKEVEDKVDKDEESSRHMSSFISSHGLVLRKLTLDAFTLTEILRLHFLTYGIRTNNLDATFRDESSAQLINEEPDLMKSLTCKTVFELSSREKIKILKVLVNQLLTHVAIHDEIDERLEKLKVAKLDLKQWQWAEQRREREEASARVKKRLEDKKAAENEPVNRQRKRKELEDDEEKAAELEMKHKQDYLKKERELSECVFRLQHRGTLLPLGRDRAYRRYWMFSALPGLFIEDDESEVGSCLPEPTPVDPNINANMSFNLSVNLARHQALKSFNGDFGKENEALEDKNCGVKGVTNSQIKSHKLLSDNHPTINGALDTRLKSAIEEDTLNVITEKPVMFGICSADGDKCPTHGSKRKILAVKWSFVSTNAQLELLISSLNPRGFREGSLKEILVAEKKRVLQSVTNCPSLKLNADAFKKDDVGSNELRKSSRLQVSNNPRGSNEDTSLQDFIELTLSDSILELEEKIYAGGLGSIKSEDREAWRDAIINQVFNSTDKAEDVNSNEKPKTDVIVNGHAEEIIGEMGNGVKVKDELEVPKSSENQNRIVNKLATSLLQIFNGIEFKYLTPPLGGSRDGEVANKGQASNLANRWEESLMASTSFSQLFLHMSTLERSIAWSRSVLNARCRICRRKGDAEHMLLCDGCDRGHHIYCLKPPLKEIPEGDWLCRDCSPESPKTKTKKKKTNVKDLEDDTEDVNVEEQENAESDNVVDDEIDEEINLEDSQSHSETEELELDEGDDGAEMCSVCEKGGELLSCEICFLAFHLKCLKPSPRRMPRGRWFCHKCSEVTQELRNSNSKAKKGGDKVDKTARKHLNGDDKVNALLDADSPRRSGRNSGRKINYLMISGKHSLHESDDDWIVESPMKKSKRASGRPTGELSDDEYYGLIKKHSPPCRRGASDDVPLDYKTCDQLLTELVRHEDGWPFLRPVGRKEVPNYHEIIKRPMDFGTMRSRLNDMMYQNNKEFVADTFLIFQNCCIFNPADSIQYEAAERISRYFYRRIREVRLNLIIENIFKPEILKDHVMDSSIVGDTSPSIENYSELNIKDNIILPDIKSEKLEENNDDHEINGGDIVFENADGAKVLEQSS